MKTLSLVPVSAANDSVQKFEAFGCHGTCRSRADSITSKGFTLSQSGRRGPGAYFWYAETERCRYAFSLAEAWYKAASNRNVYKDESDKQGAVIWGTLSAPEDEVLNLESPTFRHTLRQVLTKHWSTIEAQGQEKEAIVSSVHEMLIRKTEEKHPVSLVLATVQQPPKLSDEYAPFVGQPFAIIVRKLSCLTLDSEIEGIPT